MTERRDNRKSLLGACRKGATLSAIVLALATSGGAAPQVRSPGSGPSSAPQCEIKITQPHVAPEPHAPRPQGDDVIAAVEALTKAYARADLKGCELLLDDDCSAFDEDSDKTIVGKSAVLARLKKIFAAHQPGGPEPLLCYTVDRPYVKVVGNMAVVTYCSEQEIGGASPAKIQAFVTDVFVKTDDQWKLVHHRMQRKGVAAN